MVARERIPLALKGAESDRHGFLPQPGKFNGEGRESVGCHDLRHSCAAFAFSLGMTAVEVARLLRHSDPVVTLSSYAGLDDATVANLGEKLAAGLPR